MLRPRARIGPAGLGPKVVSLAGHHDVFQCRLKQEIQSRQLLVLDWRDIGYSTTLLMRVDECWALFIYTRFMLVDGNVTRRLAVYSFHLRHPLLFFFFPWNFNSALLFLKFYHSSVNILLNILCMNIQIFYHVMSRACENYWKFCYCHINCFHYAWSQ